MLLHDDDKELVYNRSTGLYELISKKSDILFGRFTPKTIESSIQHRFLRSRTNGIVSSESNHLFNIYSTFLYFDYDPEEKENFDKSISLEIGAPFKLERSNLYFLKEKEPVNRIIIKNEFDIKESIICSNFGTSRNRTRDLEATGRLEVKNSKLKGCLTEFASLNLKSSSLLLSLMDFKTNDYLEKFVLKGKKEKEVVIADSDIRVEEDSEFFLNERMIISNSILDVGGRVEIDTLRISDNKIHNIGSGQGIQINNVTLKEAKIKGHSQLSLSNIVLPNGTIINSSPTGTAGKKFINKMNNIKSNSDCSVLIDVVLKNDEQDKNTQIIETLVKNIKIESPKESDFKISVKDQGSINGLQITNIPKIRHNNKIDFLVGKRDVCKNLDLDICTSERRCDVDVSYIRTNDGEKNSIKIEDVSKKPSTVILANNDLRGAEISIKNEEGVMLDGNIFEGEINIQSCERISNCEVTRSEIRSSRPRRSKILGSFINNVGGITGSTIKEANLVNIDEITDSNISGCEIENVKHIKEKELEGVVEKYNVKREEIASLHNVSKNTSKRIDELKDREILRFEDF